MLALQCRCDYGICKNLLDISWGTVRRGHDSSAPFPSAPSATVTSLRRGGSARPARKAPAAARAGRGAGGGGRGDYAAAFWQLRDRAAATVDAAAAARAAVAAAAALPRWDSVGA